MVYTADMKKIALVVLAAIVVLVAAFFALNAYIYREKQEGNEAERYHGTLTGVQVCLPHADTDGPTTLECALGMQTDAGEYYALDLSALADAFPRVPEGRRFRATGLITPVELLSTDHWRKYDIEGIMSVTQPFEPL